MEFLSSIDLVIKSLNASIMSVNSVIASLNFRLRKSSIPLQMVHIFDDGVEGVVDIGVTSGLIVDKYVLSFGVETAEDSDLVHSP